MGRSTSVDCPSSAVAGSITGMVSIIDVHRTRSREHFWGSQLHARRRSAQESSSPTPGQFWPEKGLGAISRRLIRAIVHILASLAQKRRPARSEQMASWFAGWDCHADVMQGLAGWRPGAWEGKATNPIFGLSINIHTQTVKGSHRALLGTLGGGLGDPRTAPTAMDGSDRASPAGGKGLSATRESTALLTHPGRATSGCRRSSLSFMNLGGW